jgi:hypothetical protein
MDKRITCCRSAAWRQVVGRGCKHLILLYDRQRYLNGRRCEWNRSANLRQCNGVRQSFGQRVRADTNHYGANFLLRKHIHSGQQRCASYFLRVLIMNAFIDSNGVLVCISADAENGTATVVPIADGIVIEAGKWQ